MQESCAYHYSLPQYQPTTTGGKGREGWRGDRKAPPRARRRKILLPQYKTVRFTKRREGWRGAVLPVASSAKRKGSGAKRRRTDRKAPPRARRREILLQQYQRQAKIIRCGEWAPTPDYFCVMYKKGNRLILPTAGPQVRRSRRSLLGLYKVGVKRYNIMYGCVADEDARS